MNAQLIKGAILGLLCLMISGALWAANNDTASIPFDISVHPGGFGRASTADISAVLRSAADELWQHCPNTHLAGIDVYHRTDHPQTDLRPGPSGRIAIGLTAQDTYWAQYSFQFAHELCHALANYSNNSPPLASYPNRSNLWLEESLCETASLFTLRAMSHTWTTAPPFPPWRDYAQWFSSYAKQRVGSRNHDLPLGTAFTAWFHANELVLRQSSARSDWNVIIAAQLLPIFEKEPRGWGALAFFHQATTPNQSLRHCFTKWRARCPRESQHFVTKLAAVFEVEARASSGEME